MAHGEKRKGKLLNRLKRLQGQIAALERAVDEEAGCEEILRQASACRGALDGFVSKMLEHYVRDHIAGAERPAVERDAAAEHLIGMLGALRP